MKTILALFGFAGVLLISALAQSYRLDWFTIDGGGGASTGGVYSVSGTIGQPDAGAPMSGGNYSLTGGFWSLLSVVQTPGAPWLTIINPGAGAVKVSWPDLSTGWVLQENSDLATTNWVINSLPIVMEGTNKCVTVTPSVGNRFFRLFNP